VTDGRLRRPQLVAAYVVLAVGLAAGLVGAAVWALLAPGVAYQVLPQQAPVPLPTETQHRFVALAVFAMIGAIAGLAIAATAWAFASTRSWSMLVLVAGVSTASGGLAGALGGLWAPGLDAVDIAHLIGDPVLVQAAPTVTSWTGYLAAPVAAVLAYTLMVAWNGYPDLGVPRPDTRIAHLSSPGTSGVPEQQ
jgi:hypothetical protein